MTVLGIGTGGDSGAAVIRDGRILAAVNEERLSRLKLVVGFPRLSIREVMRLAGVTTPEIDAVMVGATRDFWVDELEPFPGWFQQKPTGFGGFIKSAAGRFSRFRNSIPGLEAAYYASLAPSFWRRKRAVRSVLRDEFGFGCPIRFVDHHFAHVTSAYFTSGLRDALVVSLDGGGDGRSGLVYAVRDGAFQFVTDNSSYNSLGNYYAYATHIAGFKAQIHEGKITGLAAHGEPIYVPLFREFIEVDDGKLQNRGGVVFMTAIRELERRLPPGWKREDLAASIQVHFEDVTRRFVDHWARHTGLRAVALAGGVFANVRVNQEVHELDSVDSVFVHPHMGDGGLAVGAALAACVPGMLDRTMMRHPDPIEDVYFGTELGDLEIAAALRAAGLTPEVLSAELAEEIAGLLAQGYVVARAAGRMEYGPRALGNRSILYQPTDRGVNDWLNHNLRRTEFMPFAPSVLDERRHGIFHRTEGAEHTAQFMTITFDCTAWATESLPGVVHIDGTARPHFVRRDRNPEYHAIIEAFHRLTGLPAIINTSFNMHEEPIVCSAGDCVRAFLDGNLDYLAIGNHLVKHPRGITHELKPVIRKGETARV